MPRAVLAGVPRRTPLVSFTGSVSKGMAFLFAVANGILRLINEGDAAVPEVRDMVLELCERFPLYPEI